MAKILTHLWGLMMVDVDINFKSVVPKIPSIWDNNFAITEYNSRKNKLVC